MKQAIANNLFHIIMGTIYIITLTLGLTLHEDPNALISENGLLGIVWGTGGVIRYKGGGK